MPLEKIDTINKDGKICEQELQKAMKEGFFDKPEHVSGVAEYMRVKGWNDKLLITMKEEIIKLYLPAIERMKTHDEIIKQGNQAGYYGVNIGQQKIDNTIINTVNNYKNQFDSGFFNAEIAKFQNIIKNDTSVQNALKARPSLQAKEKAQKAKEIIKKYDSTNVILQQYMTSEHVRFDPLSWEEFAKNFPDDKQVIAFKQRNIEQQEYNRKLSNSRQGIVYQQFNKPKPSTQVPQNALKLYLPGGGTHITKVTNDVYPLLHNQDGCETKLVVLSVSGKMLGKENFAFVDMKDNGDLIIKNTDYKSIRTIAAKQSWEAMSADEKIFDVFNSPETKKAQDNMAKMQHKMEPLQVMRKKFEESSLFFGKNNISPEEVEETRKMAVSVKPLIDELESTVPQRKQDKANLETMLSQLPKDSPLVGTKKAIQDMIDAYDVLIEQCEKRPGKESSLRGFMNVLLNPAQFSEVNFLNFFKKNSPMILGAVVGACVTIGSGGALGPIALGVLAGMGLGRVAQEGVNRSNILDETIVVDGKKVTLDFNNPTDVELRAKGKLSTKTFTTGLFKEFAMQFVMQIVFAKGLQASQKYINTHLAKYPNSMSSKFLKMIKPNLPKFMDKYSGSIQKVTNKIKPLQSNKSVVTSAEVVQEHREALTEEFINKLDPTSTGGYAVNFLIALYGGINPKNRHSHQQAFYDSYKIQDIGLFKAGEHTVIQQLQTDARDRIQDIKQAYINKGYIQVSDGDKVVFEKKHTITDNAGNNVIGTEMVEIKSSTVDTGKVSENTTNFSNSSSSIEQMLRETPERVLEVRFMGHEKNTEAFIQMYEGSKIIAEDIQKGDVSFENARNKLTQIRGDISKNKGSIESQNFYGSRLDAILQSDPLQERNLKDYTPMNGVYEGYINKARQYVKSKKGEQSSYYEVTEKIPTTNQEVKLTVVNLFVGGEFVNTRDVKSINAVKDYMSYLYNDIAQNNYSKDIIIQKVAELHWWSSHIMLNRRGSAFVTDTMIKGLLIAKGLHATMRKETLSPDLEAMIMDKSDFVKKYESMMEGGIVDYKGDKNRLGGIDKDSSQSKESKTNATNQSSFKSRFDQTVSSENNKSYQPLSEAEKQKLLTEFSPERALNENDILGKTIDEQGNDVYLFRENGEVSRYIIYEGKLLKQENGLISPLYNPGELDHLFTSQELVALSDKLLNDPESFGSIDQIKGAVRFLNEGVNKLPGSVKVYNKKFAMRENNGRREYTIQVQKSNSDQRIIIGAVVTEGPLFASNTSLINKEILSNERAKKEAYCLSDAYIKSLFTMYKKNNIPETTAREMVENNLMQAVRGESLFGRDMQTTIAMESGQSIKISPETYDLYKGIMIGNKESFFGSDTIILGPNGQYLLKQGAKKSALPEGEKNALQIKNEITGANLALRVENGQLVIKNTSTDDLLLGYEGYKGNTINEQAVQKRVQEYLDGNNNILDKNVLDSETIIEDQNIFDQKTILDDQHVSEEELQPEQKILFQQLKLKLFEISMQIQGKNEYDLALMAGNHVVKNVHHFVHECKNVFGAQLVDLYKSLITMRTNTGKPGELEFQKIFQLKAKAWGSNLIKLFGTTVAAKLGIDPHLFFWSGHLVTEQLQTNSAFFDKLFGTSFDTMQELFARKEGNHTKYNPQKVIENGSLDDQSRKDAFIAELNLDLEQKNHRDLLEKLMEAHNVGKNEVGKNPNYTAGVYNYTSAQIRAKIKLLQSFIDQGIITQKQIRTLFDLGYVGGTTEAVNAEQGKLHEIGNILKSKNALKSIPVYEQIIKGEYMITQDNIFDGYKGLRDNFQKILTMEQIHTLRETIVKTNNIDMNKQLDVNGILTKMGFDAQLNIPYNQEMIIDMKEYQQYMPPNETLSPEQLGSFANIMANVENYMMTIHPDNGFVTVEHMKSMKELNAIYALNMIQSSFKNNVNNKIIFEKVKEFNNNLIFQEIGDKVIMAGSDHGIKHVTNDAFGALKLENLLESKGLMSAQEAIDMRVMAIQIMMDHDMGYNMKFFEIMSDKLGKGEIQNRMELIHALTDHPVFSASWVKQNASKYEAIYGDKFAIMRNAMIDHSKVRVEDGISDNPGSTLFTEDMDLATKLKLVISIPDCLAAYKGDKGRELWSNSLMINHLHVLNQLKNLKQTTQDPKVIEQITKAQQERKAQMINDIPKVTQDPKKQEQYRLAITNSFDVADSELTYPTKYNFGSYAGDIAPGGVKDNIDLVEVTNAAGEVIGYKPTVNTVIYQDNTVQVGHGFGKKIAVSSLVKIVEDFGIKEIRDGKPVKDPDTGKVTKENDAEMNVLLDQDNLKIITGEQLYAVLIDPKNTGKKMTITGPSMNFIVEIQASHNESSEFRDNIEKRIYIDKIIEDIKIIDTKNEDGYYDRKDNTKQKLQSIKIDNPKILDLIEQNGQLIENLAATPNRILQEQINKNIAELSVFIIANTDNTNIQLNK